MTLAAPPIVAPDFTLPAHSGPAVTLSRTLGPLGGVLVFFRGHWCPYCRRYLGKLRDHLPRLRERGAELVAISPEPPATSKVLAAQLTLPFPLLSDATGRAIDAYGIRNGLLGARALLPHPAVFVLDRDNLIRFRSIDRNFKKRTTVRTILGAIEALGPTPI